MLGPYRSGTSLTSTILSSLGVDFGPSQEMFAGTKYNPYGYYERNDINQANNDIIHSAGVTLSDPGDPIALFDKCDQKKIKHLQFDWMRQGNPWGIKDPRMCATLWTWVQLNLIDHDKLRIIHVKRSIDAATASGMKDPNIPNYCDGTQQGVRKMLGQYAELAEWHVNTLKVPTFSLQYEELLGNTVEVISKLADFLDVTDPSRIKEATKSVGKKRALRKYYLHRLFVRVPKKIIRIITGKEKLPSFSLNIV